MLDLESFTQLYHESRDRGDEEHNEHILKERIRKHLRLVLCDLIILQKIGEKSGDDNGDDVRRRSSSMADPTRMA